MIERHLSLLLSVLVVIPLLSGCLSKIEEEQTVFRWGTTTSMRDSGLLEELINDFSSKHDVDIEYVAVGTGAALELGKNKDVDAIIVHAPDLEQEFLAQGYGSERLTFAWNRFILLSYDELEGSVYDAFYQIYSNQSCFISRGDFSGTHHKEQAIWQALNASHHVPIIEDENGIHPEGEWYNSIGQGMGATINMAFEKGCTTLSDRGTALNFVDTIDLMVYEFNDTILNNPYSFIPIDEKQNEWTDLFGSFLLTEGQDIIANYTIGNQSAFFPISQLTEELTR